MKPLTGPFAPILTPFQGEKLDIDFSLFREHLRFLEKQGLAGVLVFGTNGEFYSLSFEEKRQLLRSAAENRGKLRLIAGTGCTSLRETIQLAKEAEILGYDAILVLPPYYPKNLDLAGVDEFYAKLSKETQLPLLYYHFPQNTGVELSNELCEKLIANAALAGMKDSTKDSEALKRFGRTTELKIFVGNDSQILEGLRSGASGSISALANAFPELVKKIYSTNQDEANEAQRKLAQARELSSFGNLPAILKYILSKRGFSKSAVRTPLLELNSETKMELDKKLMALELLP